MAHLGDGYNFGDGLASGNDNKDGLKGMIDRRRERREAHSNYNLRDSVSYEPVK